MARRKPTPCTGQKTSNSDGGVCSFEITSAGGNVMHLVSNVWANGHILCDEEQEKFVVFFFAIICK
jgi:hypothetical protein